MKFKNIDENLLIQIKKETYQITKLNKSKL